MTHRLLILGSLNEFVALTKLARSQNIYTIVCDGNPNGPAKSFASKAYDLDVRDIDGISLICQIEQIDGIITSFSDLLFECMVKIAAKAGIPCYLSPEKLPFYRDKTVMKQTLDELYIPNPRSCTLSPVDSVKKLSHLRFPLVAKPVDSYGSRGIFVLHSAEEVSACLESASACSSDGRVLLEEYNEGFEFNLMSWVLDGKLYIISIADREKTQFIKGAIPYSTRNVYPSRLIDSVYDEAYLILTRYIARTGQTEGALSMQFYWAPGSSIQVGEIAGRFLGYEHELVEYAGGLSIEQLLLDSVYEKEALRKTLEKHSAFLPRCSAVLYFHGRNGVVSDQSSAEAICREAGVADPILFYEKGESIDSKNPRPYFLRLYIKGENRQEVDKRSEAILHKITVKNPEGEELLYQNKLTKYPR